MEYIFTVISKGNKNTTIVQIVFNVRLIIDRIDTHKHFNYLGLAHHQFNLVNWYH